VRKWSSKDLLLLFLYFGSEVGDRRGITGRTRLQKVVFIFEKEIYRQFKIDAAIPDEALPPFFAWKFGPFSKEVFADLDFLAAIGLVEAVSEGGLPSREEAEEYAFWAEDSFESIADASEYSEETFCLLERGQEYVETRILPELSDNQRDTIATYVAKFNSLSLGSVLKYVYEGYPEETVNSQIADRVFSR
jgi:uncharacterized protein YwgA